MFIPASRTRCSRARSRASSGAIEMRSAGVHTAPRTHTGTPLTCRSSPSRAMSCAQPSARKPTLRRATVSPSRTTDSSWRTGSPWVWGHHRAAPGTTSSASRPQRRGHVADTRLTALNGGARRQAQAHDAVATHDAGADAQRRQRVGRGQRHRTPRPHRRRAGGEPGGAPEHHRPVPAQVAGVDHPRAPAGARAPAPGQQRGQRAADDRELVLGPRSAARARPSRWAANIDSDSRTSSPLR